MIDKNSHTPLYIQLKEYLTDQIAQGAYPPGSQIPTEQELMHSLKLGRATVRAAVEELEHDGLIVKRHGIGSFVADHSARMGFEPMISLSYMLELLGLKSFSRVEFDKEIKVDSPELCTKWQAGQKVFHIRRIRYAGDLPVALEDDFFTPEIHAQLSGYDASKSIAHVLLSDLKIEAEKIDQTFLLRAPDKKEKADLCLRPSEQVLQMTRWLYEQGNETPISYLNFVIPFDLLQVPLAMFRRNRKK